MNRDEFIAKHGFDIYKLLVREQAKRAIAGDKVAYWDCCELVNSLAPGAPIESFLDNWSTLGDEPVYVNLKDVAKFFIV